MFGIVRHLSGPGILRSHGIEQEFGDLRTAGFLAFHSGYSPGPGRLSIGMLLCTAMRRGDCCELRWTDVDLKEGFVSVKTSKTGERAEMPMFTPLRRVIDPQVGNGSEYVFPEQARLSLKNPQGVSRRVRDVFEAAGFYDESAEPEKKTCPDTRPLLTGDELLRGVGSDRKGSRRGDSGREAATHGGGARVVCLRKGMPRVAKTLGCLRGRCRTTSTSWSRSWRTGGAWQ